MIAVIEDVLLTMGSSFIEIAVNGVVTTAIWKAKIGQISGEFFRDYLENRAKKTFIL